MNKKSKLLTLLIITCLCFSTTIFAQLVAKQELLKGWKIRNTKEVTWIDVTIPTTVQSEFIKRKFVSDPYVGNNERKIDTLDKQDWEFALYFDANNNILSQKKILLVFEGLDTYCKIKLNGFDLMNTNNMHKMYQLDVTKFITRYNNVLSVEIASPSKILDSINKNSSQKLPTDNRIFMRKAAYQFGWDFAPKILTSGIVKPVYLLAGTENITANPLFTYMEPIATLDTAKFQFSINDKPVFINGINMVPPSSLLEYHLPYYDSLISRCKAMHINMIRIWGGGVYPPEYFYNLCDKENIMVWQDFMFANAMIPADEKLKQNILEEVVDAIRKLRHHPCIVLWCGNNEIEEGWKNWSWQKNLSGEESAKLWSNYLQFFQVDIPAAVKLWDDARPYISTSPKHGWGKEASMTSGDAHYWGVWWGKEPIEKYYQKVPKFMSEYGMQAMPDIRTVKEFCEGKHMLLTDSQFTNHQKNTVGFETIRHYLKQYPDHLDSLGYIYYTQLLQRDALSVAVMAHKSAFPYCNGTMPWQLNDVWPAISWSIIDFSNRPKASYYALKKLFDKNVLTLGKYVSKNNVNVLDTSINQFALTLCDPKYEITNMKTKFSVVDFYGDLIYQTDKINWQKNDANNYYTTSFFENDNIKSYNWNLSYLLVEIKNKDGLDIKQAFYFANNRSLKLQSCLYNLDWITDNKIKVTSTGFAKDVFLFTDNPTVEFSDNFFDLLPNQSKEITISGKNIVKDKVNIFSQIDFSFN